MKKSYLPIRGYVLMIDDGLKGEIQIAYDGCFNPLLTEYIFDGLVAARTYRLKIYATDVNGSGFEFDIVE